MERDQIPAELQETWLVKGLHCCQHQQVEGSKPFTLGKKLSEIRKSKIEFCQNKFQQALEEVCQKCKDETVNSGKFLLSDLKHLEEQLQKTLDFSEKEVERVRKEWNEAIDDWKSNVNASKRLMKERCRQVLRQLRSFLEDSNLFSQEDVLSTISQLVLEMNQVLIANEQTYCEMEGRLRVSGEKLIIEKQKKYLCKEKTIDLQAKGRSKKREKNVKRLAEQQQEAKLQAISTLDWKQKVREDINAENFEKFISKMKTEIRETTGKFAAYGHGMEVTLNHLETCKKHN